LGDFPREKVHKEFLSAMKVWHSLPHEVFSETFEFIVPFN